MLNKLSLTDLECTIFNNENWEENDLFPKFLSKLIIKLWNILLYIFSL